MDRSLKDTIVFPNGSRMKNRFMLAPMTNLQSHDDGTLSEDEYNWLVMRAKGQFGMVMTCASHIQKLGQGFPGQLGIFSDAQIDGHKRLAAGIQEYGSLAVIQIFHAGMRSPEELIGQSPQCPSDNEETGAKALTLDEVKLLRDDFIGAAVRSQKSGYDGVEVHGAHGYILTQFLSPEINHRTDEYGGSPENRARLLFEIVDGIRERCGEKFLLGLRLSPERFGMDLIDVVALCQQIIDGGKLDFLDVSLWDCFRLPVEEKYQSRPLLNYFTDLDMKDVKLTVAGKIRDAEHVHSIIDSGVDFVSIGRSGILHHDFPEKVMEDDGFKSVSTPVSKDYLRAEGLGEKFVEYMGRWKNFVETN